MKDKISIDRIQLLHPRIREDATKFITEAEDALGITLRITQGLRTIAEQNAIYAQGRTKPGKIVTNAKGGSSYHNYGLAIDLVEIKGGKANWNFKYELLLPFSKKYGFTWGGNFKSIIDKPHFEKTFGLNWRQMLARNDAKRFYPGSSYIMLS